MVHDALKSEQRVRRVMIAATVKGDARIQEIVKLAQKAGIRAEYVRPEEIEKESESGNAQGILAVMDLPETPTLDEILKRKRDVFILLLNRIDYEQNMGAILRSAWAAGVDAVVAEGFEAGGHNGREETTTLCLIPLVKQAVKIPVIAAGGIGTGRGMLAAMALGADGVQIGSRFVASNEASANINFKNQIISSNEGDTKLMLKQLTPVRLLKNLLRLLFYQARFEPVFLFHLFQQDQWCLFLL